VSGCPEQWKLDVNDRYQAAVGVVSSLATASLVLPIFFLKDVASPGSGKSIADSLSWLVIAGWLLLGLSVLSAVIYQYSSAKWAKLAWKQDADMFGVKVNSSQVERALDASYFVMMVSFALGILCMVIFMATFVPPSKDTQSDSPANCSASASPQQPTAQPIIPSDAAR
jgi:hypothetical protein